MVFFTPKEQLLLDRLTLAIFIRWFSSENVYFCFTSNENCHFSSEKTVTTQNGLLIFLGKETHSETKSLKSSRILTKKLTTTTVPWKSYRILRLNPFVFIFLSFFNNFLHFFVFHFFIFFHFLSCSDIFFHFRSFSFIFVHVLCWVLKIFFLCLNFVTISLDNSHVKKQFLGPSRVVLPLGPLFLFSLLSFFLLFSFSFFLIFSSFFDFFMFFIFFFHFFRRKSFFFSFFLYFFHIYFFLLALVSEFNCFLRSLCSLEMRCPDDIGRDSWDWVGPPAWGEHASTPQSGVEAPRLLKRSQPRLYCCCCCFGVCIQRVKIHNVNKCNAGRT